MKQLYILVLILCSAVLWGQNWEVINNVNHVYDIEKAGEDILFSSWGGVVQISGSADLPLSEMEEIRQISTGDGLASNDIRSLAMIDVSETLWMGTSSNGINILSDMGLQNIGMELGFPTLMINKMIEVDSRILVASSVGLLEYYYLSGLNFPLLLHHYDSQNTGGALPSGNISDMMISDNDYLYLSYRGGISYAHIDSLGVSSAWHDLRSLGTIPSAGRYPLSKNSQKLAIAADSTIYITGIDPPHTAWESISTDFGGVSRTISSIQLSEENQLWIAYGDWNEDLLSYSTVDDTLLTVIDLDTSDLVHFLREQEGMGFFPISIIKELDNEIYLGTWGNGIARYRGGTWEYYDPDNISFPKITLAKADQNNALWFCSGIRGDNVVRKGTLGVSAFKGGSWQGFQRHNSPLHSNNILSMEIDSHNRKWFGAWYSTLPLGRGLTIYDDEANTWLYADNDGFRSWSHETQSWSVVLDDYPSLLTATIAGLHNDKYGNMLVLCYDGGVTVLDKDDRLVGEFQVPGSDRQLVTTAYHNGRQYFIGTSRDVGLAIWNHDSIPETDGPHWLSQIPPDLKSGDIYGVTSVQTPHGGWHHFVAAGTGLYMWDETNWYLYDVYIKRHIYNFAGNRWENNTLYFADEERIFGSIRTSPTAIFGDPFGRIWVGSSSNGITMFDPVTERFTNYYQGKVPLLSNQISTLGYDPLEGKLLIGTGDGLNTLRIGRTTKPQTSLQTLKAYPNPFYPDGRNSTQIVNLPIDSMPPGDNECRIFSASGNLVAKLRENPFARFEWDGRNAAGDLVSSGVYYFVVSDKDGKVKRGKLAVIR